jgi:hypothetical protein
MSMPKRAQISTFRRTYSIATVSANTGDTVNAFYVTLGNMPNPTDFTALFDQYRILEVAFTFTPYATSSTSASVSTTFPGIIGSWIDYDDANLPANIQEGQQYDSFQRNTATLPFTRIVKPRSASAAYSGAFTSYQNVYGQWIDAASPNVQFYGLKTVITGSTYATSTKVYEVEATVTLQARSQH